MPSLSPGCERRNPVLGTTAEVKSLDRMISDCLVDNCHFLIFSFETVFISSSLTITTNMLQIMERTFTSIDTLQIVF